MRLVVLLIAMIAVLAIPYPSQVSPPWQIQTVDKTGAPVTGGEVTEWWGWTPLDRMPFHVEATTDAGGWASLPGQTRWLSLGRRAQAFVEAQLSFHGNRYGPVYWIMARRVRSPALIADHMIYPQTKGVSNVDGVLTYRVVLKTVDDLSTH